MPYSKEQQREYVHQHYLDNKELYKSRAVESKRRSRTRSRQELLNYLLVHPCVDCGNSNPVVLELDHVRGVKEWNVSEMISRGIMWERIQREIEKCEVVCANCHRIRTALRNGSWFKALIPA